MLNAKESLVFITVDTGQQAGQRWAPESFEGAALLFDDCATAKEGNAATLSNFEEHLCIDRIHRIEGPLRERTS